MSKQTGAHTHEEKGKMFQLFSFYRIGSFLYRFIFRNMLLVKNILFSLAAILAGYHIIGEGFGDTYRDTKTIESFRLIFIC